MYLQIAGLVGNHRVGSSVRFVEGILGEAYHIVEYFLCSVL